jgi:hypothetical protein
MSASPASHLRLIDTFTGEITEYACNNCAGKEHELKELERKFRAQSRELGLLRADKDAEARAHESWPTLMKLHIHWQEKTGHSKARWTTDKFWQALSLWQEFGTKNVAAGIAGIAYQPNSTLLRNGKTEVHDTWKLLFRDSTTLERYIKRRPKDWILPQQFQDRP